MFKLLSFFKILNVKNLKLRYTKILFYTYNFINILYINIFIENLTVSHVLPHPKINHLCMEWKPINLLCCIINSIGLAGWLKPKVIFFYVAIYTHEIE